MQALPANLPGCRSLYGRKRQATAKGSTAKIQYYNYEQVCGLLANGSRMAEFEKRTMEGKILGLRKLI
jgi:hypothetical protein